MEIREKVPFNPTSPKVKSYPPKPGPHRQPGRGSDPAGGSKSSPLIIDSSFNLDDPGVVREILGNLNPAVREEETMGYIQFGPARDSIEPESPVGLGPAVHDEEAAACVSHFLRAGDAIEADKLEPGNGRPASPGLTSGMSSQHAAYFVHADEQAIPEAFERLGPGISDEILSGYYACFID